MGRQSHESKIICVAYQENSKKPRMHVRELCKITSQWPNYGESWNVDAIHYNSRITWYKIFQVPQRIEICEHYVYVYIRN